ncbi:MAG: hypothetical protein H7259_03085 [Cytophagales bacterium]|nr:hypothetical protein [Cytophaga sp.]
MKQLTINIPDYYYQTFMEYFKHIPDAVLLNESSFILDEQKIAVLDKRAAAPEDQFLSIEESNSRLKK